MNSHSLHFFFFLSFVFLNLLYLISYPDLLLTKPTRDLGTRLHKTIVINKINITTTINTEKKKRKLHETILVFTTVLLYNREKKYMAERMKLNIILVPRASWGPEQEEIYSH